MKLRLRLNASALRSLARAGAVNVDVFTVTRDVARNVGRAHRRFRFGG